MLCLHYVHRGNHNQVSGHHGQNRTDVRQHELNMAGCDCRGCRATFPGSHNEDEKRSWGERIKRCQDIMGLMLQHPQ